MHRMMIAETINLLDSSDLYLTVMAMVLLFCTRRFFTAFLLSAVFEWGLVAIFKEVVQRVRPCVIDPASAMLCVGGYSFPSGGAGGALFLSFCLASLSPSPYRWVGALIYTLFVSASRVALGVHYTTDVLGGWLIGAICALIGIYCTGMQETDRHLRVWSHR